MGRKTTRTYFQDDEIIISRADGTTTRVAIDSLNDSATGKATENTWGHVIDAIDATLEDVRSRQRLQTGLNKQHSFSTEDQVDVVEATLEDVRGRQRLESGTNKQTCLSLENSIDVVEATLEDVRGRQRFEAGVNKQRSLSTEGSIDTIDATVEDLRNRQRLESGTNKQYRLSVEDEVEELCGEVESLRTWNEYLTAAFLQLLGKLDTDFTAQDAAVTSSQLDVDYNTTWGT